MSNWSTVNSFGMRTRSACARAESRSMGVHGGGPRHIEGLLEAHLQRSDAGRIYPSGNDIGPTPHFS